MNLNSLRHSYILKKQKGSNESGIYHRLGLIINGRKVKTLEISSRFSVDPDKWDGKIKGNSAVVRETNDDLQAQCAEIKNLFRIEATKPDFDPALFKLMVQVKVLGLEHLRPLLEKGIKPVSIGDLFHSYIENYGSRLALRRLKLYKFVQKKFSAYLKSEFGREDVAVAELGRNDFIRFQKQLIPNRKRNTVSSYLKALKAVGNDGVKSQKITHSPFDFCETGFEDGDRTPLNVKELQRIANLMVGELTPRENVSRWIFLFACFTGLSYSDLVSLEENMISQTNDGIVISLRRQKSKVKCVIPRNPELETILGMFSGFRSTQPDVKKILPVPSYNKYNNEDLKSIGKKAKINKRISTHVARHTFACHWLNNGGSYEALSKILAHKKISTTQIYGKVGMQRVLDESKIVFNGNTLQIDAAAPEIQINQAFVAKHLTGKKVHGQPSKTNTISSTKQLPNGTSTGKDPNRAKRPKN